MFVSFSVKLYMEDEPHESLTVYIRYDVAEIGNSEASLGLKWHNWLLGFENYVSAVALTDEG